MTLITEELIRSNPYIPDKDLFPVIRSLSHMSNPISQKLLYLLHRCVSARGIELEKTPILQIGLKQLYEYLGLMNSTDPIAELQTAIYNICNNPIHFIRREEDGINRRWEAPTWLVNYRLLETERSLYLHLNPNVKPFLDLLEALSVVRPESCDSLSRDFPTWLYIILMNAAQYGDYWAIDIELFSNLSMVEDKGSYKNRSSPLASMSQQLLGLSPTTAGREEARTARKEKRPARYIAYKFISRGNLPTIRLKSELMVNAMHQKVKNTLSNYIFSFREEDNNGFEGIDPSVFKKYLTFGEVLEPYTALINSINALTLKEKTI